LKYSNEKELVNDLLRFAIVIELQADNYKNRI